ncbi:MAG: hypothetical protein A3G87_03695 [Omnitrophica bacterium RIFCSPLOWO2_12_FULL_50_11]|nr:MAG: hypothetical protein A3G87_03695 [Omnitrophica bacterium RIFCSPLOWO2_12_FULL_50_11]
MIRKKVFTTNEAEESLQWSKTDLYSVLFRLVQKGKLVRIKRGLFCLVPPGTGDLKRGYPQNWFLIAKALAGDRPYFLSHYSAMQLHGMTTEAIQTLFISRPDQRRLPKDLRIPVRFITIPKERFWGLEEKWVTNEERVRVSDLERTILDILDRPDLSGGISEIARGLWLAKKEINGSKLLDYVKRFDSLASVKRLGFLMESFDLVSEEAIDKIHKFIQSSTSYAFLDPTSKKEGKYLDRWRLRINVDMVAIQKNLMT